jgi:hypothetical protein
MNGWICSFSQVVKVFKINVRDFSDLGLQVLQGGNEFFVSSITMQTLWWRCLLTSMFSVCYIGKRQRKKNCGHIKNGKCSKCMLLKGWCWWCMLLRSNFVEAHFYIVEREVCFGQNLFQGELFCLCCVFVVFCSRDAIWKGNGSN